MLMTVEHFTQTKLPPLSCEGNGGNVIPSDVNINMDVSQIVHRYQS